jgi:acetylornithine/succinyldiaminopimelate/putrescine aminotransferase
MNQRELFLRHVGQTSSAPLAIEIIKAEGTKMWDKQDNEYTDLISGISVCNVGHRNPNVIAAIHQQLDAYMHVMVYGELIESPQVQYAHQLALQLPEKLNSVYFTNSGAEATEGAMKLAKRITGRPKIVSFKNSYHGSTQGALSVMGDEYWRNAYRPLLPGVIHADYNAYSALDYIDEHTACVIAEPIQAEMGIKAPDMQWMQALHQKCKQVGAMLVLDEIQTGFGRTGTLFAFEQFGIVPDILLLGKALGGGMPLGAFVSSTDNMNAFTNHPVLGHITTFGGHPVCCAAGLAALQFLLDEQLMKSVAGKSELFQSLLVHPMIKEVRSAGLLIAVEFDSFDTNKKIIDRCIEKGVFTDWFLFASQCMRIAPPLIMNEKEIHSACATILECCDAFYQY